MLIYLFAILWQLSVLCFNFCSFLICQHFSWCVTCSLFFPLFYFCYHGPSLNPCFPSSTFLKFIFLPCLLFCRGKVNVFKSGKEPLGVFRRYCCLLICVIRFGNFSCGRVTHWLCQATDNLMAAARCKRQEQQWIKLQTVKVVLWEDLGQQ